MLRALTRTIPGIDVRYELTANTTFYVRTDGDDDNSGRTNSASGAFLTLQGAIDYLKKNVDFDGYRVTVQLAAGTYSGGLRLTDGFVGEGATDLVTIVGNAADPTTVVLTNAANCIRVAGNARLGLSGVSIGTTGSGIGLQILNGGYVELSAVRFIACVEEMMLLSGNALMIATGNITVAGNAGSFIHITNQSRASFEGRTITFVGTPVFSTYVVGLNTSSCSFASGTLVGDKQGQTLVHISSTLNLSSVTGKLFGNNSQPRQNAGGIIIYNPLQDIIYVRSDGSDFNDGYANTADRAFATIAAAITWLETRPYDSANSRTPIIRVGAAVRTTPIVLTDIPNVDYVILEGDETTPSNCTISTTSATCISANFVNTTWFVRGFKLQTTTSGNCITAQRGSRIQFRALEFGACAGIHIYADRGSIVEAQNNYTISGGAVRHLQLAQAAQITIVSLTVTLTGTPAFSGQFASVGASCFAALYPTWSGAATGPRYDLRGNGVIDANGGGTSSLPGNSAGSSATGGQYV